jgi:hypothetical protein
MVDFPYYLRSFIYYTYFIYCFFLEREDKQEVVDRDNILKVRKWEYMRKWVDRIVLYFQNLKSDSGDPVPGDNENSYDVLVMTDSLLGARGGVEYKR